MMKFSASAVIALVVVLYAIPAFSQTPDATSKQAMVDLCKAYDAAWNGKGAAAVAPMFAEDALLRRGTVL